MIPNAAPPIVSESQCLFPSIRPVAVVQDAKIQKEILIPSIGGLAATCKSCVLTSALPSSSWLLLYSALFLPTSFFAASHTGSKRTKSVRPVRTFAAHVCPLGKAKLCKMSAEGRGLAKASFSTPTAAIEEIYTPQATPNRVLTEGVNPNSKNNVDRVSAPKPPMGNKFDKTWAATSSRSWSEVEASTKSWIAVSTALNLWSVWRSKAMKANSNVAADNRTGKLISFASQLILRGALRGDTTLPDLPRHGKKRAGSCRRAGHAHIIVDLTYMVLLSICLKHRYGERLYK
jgi:hypothetical protein